MNLLSFANLRLVDFRNGHSQYLSSMEQLIDALPKTLDPASRFALRGHVARPGQSRLRHRMRAAMWFLLPSDGIFRRSSSSLQYYLTRQGRSLVLRGGEVTRPPLERCLSQPPRCRMSTQVKHPQLPQPPQHLEPPRSAANQNSFWPNLLDQAELGRPIPASARNPQQDLVESTSPGLTFPSAQSDCIETTSLGRPLGL